jgi:hypothetical protein
MPQNIMAISGAQERGTDLLKALTLAYFKIAKLLQAGVSSDNPALREAYQELAELQKALKSTVDEVQRLQAQDNAAISSGSSSSGNENKDALREMKERKGQFGEDALRSDAGEGTSVAGASLAGTSMAAAGSASGAGGSQARF